MDALGLFGVEEHSAAGVQTIRFESQMPRKIGWANSSTGEFSANRQSPLLPDLAGMLPDLG